jgi:hypothetical protein
MKPSSIFALALALGLLTGCSARKAATALPVMTATASPTAAPTIQATSTVTPSRRPLTQTPTPAATTTPTPAPTGDPAELPLPTLPDLSGDAGNYQLAIPSPQSFLDLTNIARQQLMMMNGLDSSGTRDLVLRSRWDWLSQGVSGDVYAISDAINAAFLRAYPGPLPNPGIVLQDPYQNWWIEDPDIQPYPPRLARDAAIAYLNQQKQPLADHPADNPLSISKQIQLDAASAELDGTPGREWIVFIETPYMDARYNGFALWQAVDERPGPQYAALSDPVLAQPFLWPATFEVRDLTGDGRTDLIVSGVASGFGMVRNDFLVYRWTDSGFKDMSHIAHWEEMGEEESGGEPLITFLQDTPPALRVVTEVNRPWGCVYKRIEVYRWTGGFEQRIEQNSMDPSSPSCLLAEVFYSNTADNGDAFAPLPRLERALAGLDPKYPADRPKILYARYQIAVLEAVRGQDAAARRQLDLVRQGFANDPPTAQYLQENLDPLLAQPALNAMQLCSLGSRVPSTVFSTWWSGLDYPYSLGGPQSGDFCSPGSLIEPVMQARLPMGIQFSESLLSAAGLHAQAVKQVAAPGLEQPVWLAIIEDDSMYTTLVGSIPIEKGLRWKILGYFNHLSGTAQWLVSDVTGDGVVDIAIAAPLTDKGDCQEKEQAYQVFIAGRFLAGRNDFTSTMINVCHTTQPPLDLNELMADHNGDGLSDRLLQALDERRLRMYVLAMPHWPAPPGPVWYSNTFDQFQAEQDLESKLLSALYHNGDPAQTRAGLLALRDRLFPDPPGRHTRQQIDYLIALSYELEGKQEEAVKGYLALANASPQTLWSSLAGMRVEKKR